MPRIVVVPAPDHPLAARGPRALDVDDGAVLLDVILGAAFPIATRCGGAMECRTCLVVVDGAASAPGVKERDLVAAQGGGPGARLACQVRVRGDLTVTVPNPLAIDDDT